MWRGGRENERVPKKYVVGVGDGLQRIGFRHGLLPSTIWNDPSNDALKRERPNPETLLPGDELVIPDRREKVQQVAVDRHHVFRRRSVPSRIRVRLQDEEVALANTPCVLQVDGVEQRVTSDADGIVSATVSPEARVATLRVDEDGPTLTLSLGHLDPASEPTGAQGRLRNLGFYSGPAHGNLDEATVTALQRFQESAELEPTGELDTATVHALASSHGRTETAG